MNKKRTFKLTIEYDGTNYFGFQRQKDHPTIQAHIESALGKVCNEHISIVSSGRTDSGVHAKGHVASFATSCRLSRAHILRGVNSYLPGDIAVLKVSAVSSSFHAQYNAKRKIYRYEVFTGPIMSPLKRLYAYHYPHELSVEQMRLAAKFLIGRHDFRSFAARSKEKENTVRMLRSIRIRKKGNHILFVFEGEGFLHTMVRVLVGTLLHVGIGKIKPQEMKTILHARRRECAGPTVPGHGLVLMRVFY
jgi:tRNA pseudouridine38-40 synthase